jgi:L-asparaginase II
LNGGALHGPAIVAVTRGPRVESVHAVAACAADARGRVAYSYGAIDVPIYLRSAAKPFITAEIVASGAADRFGFDARELAVISASHNGEPFHIAAVAGILAKIGLDVSALQCGATPPAYENAAADLAASGVMPTAIHNNCSGKHAGILALCVQAGYPIETYLEPAHPAQRRILAFCARMSGDDPAAWDIGIDGCGIPVYATTLQRAATAFARFATFDEVDDADAAALVRVRAAMIAEPAYVAGTKRFDTALMEAAPGAIACKAGAEAVHAAALLGPGLGCVLKVVDGNRRAAPPAQIATLAALGVLDASARAALEPFARPEVYNVAGRSVGRIEAAVPAR